VAAVLATERMELVTLPPGLLRLIESGQIVELERELGARVPGGWTEGVPASLRLEQLAELVFERSLPLVSKRYHPPMAMTLRLTEAQAEALRARASREGRSMQQVARAAVDDYLLRAEDDELTDRLTERGAQRFADLLRRLGE
jgi:hypothetical protein